MAKEQDGEKARLSESSLLVNGHCSISLLKVREVALSCSSALRELYSSVAAAVRACDDRIPDLVAVTKRLSNRRREVIRGIYREEYRAHFTPQGPSLAPTLITRDQPSESDQTGADDGDLQDWLLRLEQEEASTGELGNGTAVRLSLLSGALLTLEWTPSVRR